MKHICMSYSTERRIDHMRDYVSQTSDGKKKKVFKSFSRGTRTGNTQRSF